MEEVADEVEAFGRIGWGGLNDHGIAVTRGARASAHMAQRLIAAGVVDEVALDDDRRERRVLRRRAVLD